MNLTEIILSSPWLRNLVGGAFIMGQRCYEAKYQDYLRGKYEIDPTFKIGPFTRMTGDGRIKLGHCGSIGCYCNIQSVKGRTVEIGKGTALSHNIYIYTQNRLSNQDFSKPLESFREGDISIGEYCWIGYGSIILEGVRIGDNVIIGAHSLVNKDIPNNTVAVGIPCKPIKFDRIKIE